MKGKHFESLILIKPKREIKNKEEISCSDKHIVDNKVEIQECVPKKEKKGL